MSRGGKREGAGRPQGTVSEKPELLKNKIFTTRCTEEEYEQIKKYAAQENKNLSTYIMDKALKKEPTLENDKQKE